LKGDEAGESDWLGPARCWQYSSYSYPFRLVQRADENEKDGEEMQMEVVNPSRDVGANIEVQPDSYVLNGSRVGYSSSDQYLIFLSARGTIWIGG
jgi:hypothetical protein